MNHAAIITLTGPAEAVATVPALAGYVTYAEAATRTNRTPWQIFELVECGQLTAVTFDGRRHVDAAAVAALVVTGA